MDSREVKEAHEFEDQLCFDKILCDEELFKQRKPSDKTVPQRGGEKDFSPDDSWLQAKRLEKFYEERRAVLAESRVERVGSLVTGEWNPEIQLVELHKEMGKFWSSMGFSDKSRKWLYPEEAVFLMETNTLEVWYRGLPVSIQQAYTEFLKSSKFEEYLVYAHLRRIGYTVLRHQGRLLSTKYERKIKLDKHINLKKRKKRPGKQSPSLTDRETGDTPQKRAKLVGNEASQTEKVEAETANTCNLDKEAGKSSSHLSQNDFQSENKIPRTESGNVTSSVNENQRKNMKTIDKGKIQQTAADLVAKKVKDQIVDTRHGKIGTEAWERGENCVATRYSVWNFDEIGFPDLGDSECPKRKGEILQRFLPDGVPPLSTHKIDADHFFKQRLKSQACQKSRFKYGQEIDDFDLEFSCDGFKRVEKVCASNWREYKEKMMESMERNNFVSPVEHLWTDEVIPLVRPDEALNTESVLNKLQVIKTWKPPETISMTNSEARQAFPKVVYDVYKPDAKFRKSNPGTPDHRVCVVRSTEEPPSLSTLTSITSYYDDEVPLHWAVVDEGEIAFYSFTQISLPTHIFKG